MRATRSAGRSSMRAPWALSSSSRSGSGWELGSRWSAIGQSVDSACTCRSTSSRERAEMGYFVTGGTGFIGRNLIEQLLERDGTIYVLVREGSRGRLEELRARWG